MNLRRFKKAKYKVVHLVRPLTLPYPKVISSSDLFPSRIAHAWSMPFCFQAKEPKINVKIDVINATFQPEKIGNPNGLQITYLKDNKTRNIFVYHESGKVSGFSLQSH